MLLSPTIVLLAIKAITPQLPVPVMGAIQPIIKTRRTHRILQHSSRPIVPPAIQQMHGLHPRLIMIRNIFQYTVENMPIGGQDAPNVILRLQILLCSVA
jgi:hypothetical protein